MSVMNVIGDSLQFQNLPSTDENSMTPENMPATGAQDISSDQIFSYSMEIMNIILNVAGVMMFSLQQINSMLTKWYDMESRSQRKKKDVSK